MSEPYEAAIDKLITTLAENPAAYPTAERMIAGERLIPEHPANVRLLRVLNNPTIPITPGQLERGLARKLREMESVIKRDAAAARKLEQLAERQAIKEEMAEAARQRVVDALGVIIQTEREMIPAHLDHGGWAMDFGGSFSTVKGKTMTFEAMLEDIQLTASDLGLTRKPLELKDKNFQRALNEYYRAARTKRKETIWRNISELSDDRDAVKVIAEWFRLCRFYFRKPELAARAVMKIIWAVKRKMAGLPIPYHHFVVFYSSQQGSGKTTLWMMIKAVIRDLCKDVSDLNDLLSNAQLDLFSYFLIEVPEMTGADRADMPKLKSLITAASVSRRVFFTQNMRDQEMCSTFCGTSNVPLGSLFKDSSGARRMVQCDVRRIKDIQPHWDEIVKFDYAGLWQAVDHLGPDPLDMFKEELEEIQETMRLKDRVESWLDDFAANPPTAGYDVSCSSPPTLYVYNAKALFVPYRSFETWAFGGSPMTLSNWTSRFKELIDSEMAEEWSYQSHARRCLFTLRRSNVIALAPPKDRAA